MSVDDGYDTDAISLTSTVPEETAEGSIYSVEDILAERLEEDGQPRYLVKWERYPLNE